MKLYLFLLISLFLLPLCSSYDTGHHTDLTRNVLQLLGFNNYSTDVCTISNWMVDYFAYTEIDEIHQLNGLHFDNMFNIRNVSNYFNTLATNTRSAVQTAVSNNDILTFLGLIGLTSHAVQDFYTHSSWTDYHTSICNCYRDDTWFSALDSVNGYTPALVSTLRGISSYSWGDICDPFLHDCLPGQVDHGDYCAGINKDSYDRPKFEASYGFGFAGTYEWIFNILIWADQVASIQFSNSSTSLPGVSAFVINAKSYTPTGGDYDDLLDDVDSSIEVSYATREPQSEELDDGHWKGAGSGSYARLATATLDFVKRSSIYSQQFTDKQIWAPITTPNPYYQVAGVSETNPPAYNFIIPYSKIPLELRNFTKVKVRTTNVTVADHLNTPSPYALIVIDGQEFEEAVQANTEDFTPHWTAIRYIRANQTTINIRYSLWNDKFPSDDDQYPLQETNDGYLDFTMDVYTRQLTGYNGFVVNGVYDRYENPFIVDYDTRRVAFYATQQNYGVCNFTNQYPNEFCHDEAYGQYLLHPICGDLSLASSGRQISSFWTSYVKFW